MTVETTPRPSGADELQALIEEARWRTRQRRRRNAIMLLAVVLAAGALYLFLSLSHGGGAARSQAAPVAGIGPRTFRAGQFWYTRTITTQRQWMPAGGITIDRHGYTHRHGPNVLFDLRISDESWVGVDGTIRDRMVVAGARFASAADRARWLAYGRRVPNFNHVWLGWMSHDEIAAGAHRFPPLAWEQPGEWTGPSRKDVGDGLLTYRQLLSLPTRPAALRRSLQQAETAFAQREARTAHGSVTNIRWSAFAQLSTIVSLLTSPLPGAERLALFHAALTIPGAKLNTHAHDGLGRRGVEVSASSARSFQGLIFDPATRTVLQTAPGVAVVAQGLVDSPHALPKGVAPIHPAGAPPAPQTPTITPSIGNPTTRFRLRLLPISAADQSGRSPRLHGLLIGTPGPRCFASFAPQPLPLAATASTHLTRTPIAEYTLSPSSLHRRAWCPGRYELTVAPTTESRTTSPAPSVGSSIDFEVR